jgi:hypothetical protein
LTQSSATTQRYTSLAAIKSAAPTSHFIDILISNVWPYSVTALSSASLPLPELASAGVYPFDDVVRRTKPRYHFAACSSQPPVFWEREPFVWENDQGRITRFVSLGAFGGVPAAGKKQRVVVIYIPIICLKIDILFSKVVLRIFYRAYRASICTSTPAAQYNWESFPRIEYSPSKASGGC